MEIGNSLNCSDRGDSDTGSDVTNASLSKELSQGDHSDVKSSMGSNSGSFNPKACKCDSLKTSSPFASLETLCLSETGLGKWKHLTAVNKFPALKAVRIMDVKLGGRLSQDDRRKLFVACLPNIKMLNGSEVSVTEREKAERHLLRHFGDKKQKPEIFHTLEQKHVVPSSGHPTQKAGVTLKVDNRLPNLVNLNEDPQLSEVLLYNIKDGVSKVGRKGSNTKPDIQLNGALIADNHCIISNMETVVSIMPIGEAPTYVNGVLILEPTTLHHGDRVILGGDHYYRFNHPIEVQRNRKDKNSGRSQEMRDFEFAKSELMGVQEARLQEARQLAQEEMLEEVERAKKDAETRLASMEKTMREENEEKVKEAEGKIQKLKKQKMMLEQEVIANRKRQQLEAEASLKETDAVIQGRSRILDLLQEEKEAAALKLEELRSRRDKKGAHKLKSPTPTSTPSVVEAASSKMDLYKIALQVREANKISQYLKKYTVFGREDFLDGEEVKTVIKVTNTRLNVSTHWGLSKFEERLMQMRDLYQNDGESSADEDDVFNDPEDQWGKEGQPSSPISPKNGTKRSVPSPSLRQALLSSVSSSINSSIMRQDSTGGKGDNVMYPAVASLCKDLVNMDYSEIKSSSLEESVSDKILNNCLFLKCCIEHAFQLPVVYETKQQGTSKTELLSLSCLQLTTGYQLLRNNVTVLASMHQSVPSPLIQNLLGKMVDQVKVIGGHVVRFLQGSEGEIDSLLEEATTRLHDGLHTMCKMIGELALATDMRMLFFEEASAGEAEAVSAEISQSFFSGCETFIDKTLQGAMTAMEDLEAKSQLLCEDTQEQLQLGTFPQNLEISVATCRELLLVCQEIQVELDSSMVEPSLFTPPHFCAGNYRRSQELISHVSSLVEGVSLLIHNAEGLMQGREFDIRKLIKCADVIKLCSEKLTSVSGRDLNQLIRSSSESGSTTESSILSETQVAQLEFVCTEIQQSLSQLVESVQKILELDRVPAVSTPRGKRLLPSQPAGTPLARFTVKKSSLAKDEQGAAD